jgi:hypothetical protein
MVARGLLLQAYPIYAWNIHKYTHKLENSPAATGRGDGWSKTPSSQPDLWVQLDWQRCYSNVVTQV